MPTAKLSVDSTGFKQGIDQAKASLKTLDAALKTNEASFKAGGNAEIYMQQKTQLLNDKMTKQRDLVTMLQGKMEKMKAAGVSPLSTEYQRLETQMLNAQTSMLETKVTIDELDSSQQNAASSAEKLSDGVSDIGKKMSIDQVLSGINAITEAMKSAAQQVVQLGQEMWSQITETAGLADDLATTAARYGLDPELAQKQIKVFDTMAETSIEAYQKARMKINKVMANPSEEQKGYLEALGLITPTYDSVNLLVKDAETAMWAAGERLHAKVKSGELSRDDADIWAQALFGRGFAELNPMFEMGREGFEAAVQSQSAATTEAIENGAKLNDSIIMMEKNFETLKLQIVGEIAPSLQTVTDSISALINKLIEYAQSEDGQALLQSMADSIASMLSGLTEIDPEDVISKFTNIFDTIKDGFNWITEHKDDVYNAIKYIAGAFALLKVSETVLTFIKLGQGVAGLLGGKAAASAAAGAAGTATAGGAGLTLGGIGSWFSSKFGGLAKYVPSTAAMWNLAPVGDWFMNNTYLGQNIRNTGDISGSVRAAREKLQAEINENLATFSSDWAGVFSNIFTDPNKQASKMKLFDPQQLQAEFDSYFGSAEPSKIPVEPDIDSNAAAQISAEIGTVSVDVTPRVNRDYWLSLTGGAGGGNRWTSQHLHATGMPWVPYDGYLSFLHRGERVITAAENMDYIQSAGRNRGMTASGGETGGRMIDVTLMIGPERLTEVLLPLVDNGLGEIVSLNRR